MSFDVFDSAGTRVARSNDFGEARLRMRALGYGAEVRRGETVVVRHERKRVADEVLVAAPSGVGFTREVITPELAATLLDGRAPNRTPNQERIASYANDMKSGRWADTHQPIALGPGGELVDGEHRLRAVLLAGVPVAMWVARGVQLDNRWAIDQGRARSVGDALKINDGLKHGPKLAKWCRVIESMRANCKAARVVSPARVREIASQYPESIEWALTKGPRGRLLARAPIVAALIYAHRVLPEVTERFGAKFATGESLVAGDPAYALRHSVMSAAVNTRENDKTYVLRTLRCVVAELRGERLERVNSSEEALTFVRGLHEQLASARGEERKAAE